MDEKRCDVVIVGGGPSGAMTAGLLARAGRKVVVLEREAFPRFHIGESMLAHSLEVLERAGLLERVRATGFMRKDGAVFVSADGERMARFDFSEGDPPSRHPHAFQVDRATFDHLILTWAKEQGADVRHGVVASDLESRGGRREARIRAGGTTFIAPFVVDAAGLDSTAAKSKDWDEDALVKDRIGLFGHFRLARPAVEGVEVARTGDIVIVEDATAWTWFIPLRDSVTSVGFVLPIAELAALGGETPEERFWAMARRMPTSGRLLEGSERKAPIRGIRSYGRATGRLHGDGIVLAGDAAGFLDPVFSSGLCLALGGAERLAHAIDASLTDPAGEDEQLAAYEAAVRGAFRAMQPFVEHWYGGALKTSLYHREGVPVVKRRITSVLAGELWGAKNPLATDGDRWLRVLDAAVRSGITTPVM